MLKLKFASRYRDPILRGAKQKTSRVALEDDRLPSPDDVLVFQTPDGETFAWSVVAWTASMTVREYVASGYMSQDGSRDVVAYLDRLREYYPDAEISLDTELDVIRWEDVVPFEDHRDADLVALEEEVQL